MNNQNDPLLKSGGATKRCTECGGIYPETTAYFYKTKTGYWRGSCKICLCAERQRYYDAHREEVREQVLRYRQAHPKEVKERNRRYAETHREASCKQVRGYQKAHPEETRKQKRGWLKKHPEKGRIYFQRRKARRRALLATFADADWQKALDYFGYCCAVCRRPRGLWHILAQDHWIPLSKGGHYTPDNIVPLCHGEGGCNNSKNNKMPHEWLTKRFGKRRAEQIERRVSAYFESLRHDPSPESLRMAEIKAIEGI